MFYHTNKEEKAYSEILLFYKEVSLVFLKSLIFLDTPK